MQDNTKKLEKLLGVFEDPDVATKQEVAEVFAEILNQFKELDSNTVNNLNAIENKLTNLLDSRGIVSEIKNKKEIDSINKRITKEIESIKKIISSIELKHGKDGKDADEEVIVGKVLEQIKLPEYKEIVLDSPEQMRDKLESLEGEDRLDASAIKNLPKTVQNYIGGSAGNIKEIVAGTNITVDNSIIGYPKISASGGSVSAFTDLTDVPSSYTGQGGKVVAVKSDVSGLEFISATSTDEKVKYDASDPTAGYVADKIIAGTGISVAEGTGANENKLVITNSAPDQTVAITGSGAATVTGTYPSFNVAVSGAGGDVVGPASNTAFALASFGSDTSGKILIDSGVDKDAVYALVGNNSGVNTGDQVGDNTTITGAGTAGDPFVATYQGADKLSLDQTTPQTVINGTPIFGVGLKSNALVEVSLNATGVSHLAGTALAIVGDDNTAIRIGMSSFGTGGVNAFATRHARGTAASPSAVQNGDQLISLEGWGYGTTGYTASPKVMFRGYAAETWSDSAQGSKLSLWTTPNGSVVPAERLKIDNAGIVNIPNLTASKAVFTDASKNLTSTGIGTSSQFIKGDGSLDSTVYGTGNVTKVGTPVDNQVGIWTGDGTIEGDADLTFDGDLLTFKQGKVGGTAGAGFLDFVGQSSNPTSPTAGIARIHAVTTNGFTRIEQDNEGTTNIVFGRDSVIIVKNDSGGSLALGDVVYIKGVATSTPTVGKARANAIGTLPALGLVMDAVADGGFTRVMRSGLMTMNTSAFSSTDKVYVSTATAGALTATRPSGTSGAFVQRIGTILTQSATGIIEIEVSPSVLNMESGTTAATWTGNAITGTTLTATTGVDVGNADTSITRVSAGVIAVEGVTVLTTAGGTLTGDLTLGENTSIVLDPALSADGKYCGITEAVTAGETVAFGNTVYFKSDGKWWKTDADAEATAGPVKVGIVVVGGNADATITIMHNGKIREDDWNWTVGDELYLDTTTAGGLTATQPSGTDDVIRIVGYAQTADSIWFEPSKDYITHT